MIQCGNILVMEGHEMTKILIVEDEKKLVRAPVSLFVNGNKVLLRELKRLLGEKNVVLRS